ncbi:alpha-D-ribose 1-methylphosphonate 5-triphosphate diphosphatase [Roseovarius sp. MMSF_3281]|uniref:alpha-D-ribose 1-methylphosphonate 5-triphosphate diphosphatase n=1 Tax=Roseovarius sp. MMSF_3281 TaxID=3046694 RepID=UPI0027402F25|nr:alpha-D-ribose 1-methylphosphonate 5-triphosphate diphosphatase [Roseovarius sp. MMSF_3281]
MTAIDLTLQGAEVLLPDGLAEVPLALSGGQIADTPVGREVDLRGYMVLPGIVDIHGDAFEKHLAPRRGAMKDLDQGLVAAEAEIAGNGISTSVLAQFFSWEGGMRGPEFAGRVLAGLDEVRDSLMTDLRVQLRFEICMLDSYGDFEALAARHGVDYVVFNDHLPHEELAKGKRPPRLTGQALRIGKNPEKHLADLQAWHAAMDQVPAAVDALARSFRDKGVAMGSHDDRTQADRAAWRARGARIAEFPETLEAGEAAHAGGDPVILGAPNLVRGGSHKGNVSALEMVAMGYCTALASDYHYPSMRRAAFLLSDGGVLDLAAAWGLISAGPAEILGLEDRGALQPGKRADLIVMEPATRRVCATMSAGRFSYLSGEVAARFIG